MLEEKMATWRAMRARFGDLKVQRRDCFEGNKARTKVLILGDGIHWHHPVLGKISFFLPFKSKWLAQKN
jgi:hypothetical protein